jgi:endo-1,4-beta-xylanase
MQGHYRLTTPGVELIEASINAFAAEGVEVLVTDFRVFRDHGDVVSSVTLWGVSDGHSWLNNWPLNGRTNYALLFDRQLRPKRALQRVIEVATEGE